MLVRRTEESKMPQWAAIDAMVKARSAYDRNRSFFNSQPHRATVSAVTELMRGYFGSYRTIITTCRPKTSRRPLNTEVKFLGITRGKDFAAFLRGLDGLGIDENLIIYKPATESFSVHVS